MIHRMLRRSAQGRALPLILSCLLVLSLVTTCILVPAENAYADTAELTVGHKIEYGGYDTNAFSVNGFEAYCGDPSSKTPAAGSYEMQPLRNATIAAGLWYGFGGPGFDAALWPASSWNGPMNDDAYRVATHVALAYLASGSTEFAYGTCDDAFKDWCASQLFGDSAICGRIRSAGFTIDGASTQREALPQGFMAYIMVTGTDTQIMYAMDYHPRGNFMLQKASARPALSEDNDSYSLAGAQYGVFSDAACTDRVATLVTDERGMARSPDLEPGTYRIKELSPPSGYALDDATTTVRLDVGDNGTVRMRNEPQSDPVDLILQKTDAETGEPSPMGGATLANTEYTVQFFAGQFADLGSAEDSGKLRRTWTLRTNERGELHLDDAAKVAGDDFYRDAQDRIVLPLGTVVVQESAPPVGYLLSDEAFILNVTAHGAFPVVSTYDAPIEREQAIRGDLSFVKVREADQQRLANIPFRLRSNTTGEEHILVTDENGEVRTEAGWNPHTQRTNANDAAVREDGTVDETALDARAGVWFGTESPRDDLSALPYDTYSLTELAVPANAGLELIDLPSITIERNALAVNGGTLDDQSIEAPTPPTASPASSPVALDEPDPKDAVDADPASPEPAAQVEPSPPEEPRNVEPQLARTGDDGTAALVLGAIAASALGAMAILLRSWKRRTGKRRLYRERLHRTNP